MSLAGLRPDPAPFRASRGFRIIFCSRTITALTSQATEVALLVQAKQLTGSPLAVGLLGMAELVPMIVFGLYGGALADRFDRRALLRWCEAGLALCSALLLGNALLPRPALWPLYAIGADTMAVSSLQRPSFDASIPRLVGRDQLTAAAALLSLSLNASVIFGSSLGGVLAVTPGPWLLYALDVAGPLAGFVVLGRLGPLPRASATGVPALRSVLDGLRYALGRRDLLGSYLADMSAMIFAYPNALFPFMATALHAPWSTGVLFAAPSVGAFCLTAVSGWMNRVRRHGRAIALAASGWGVAMIGFGLSPDVYLAVAFLIAAGVADEMSGIFRDVFWNQSIPDEYRGRLAGVELLSYGVGPPAGQFRSGVVASLTSVRTSLVSGGVVCVGAVALVCAALPGFLRYHADPVPPPQRDSRHTGQEYLSS